MRKKRRWVPVLFLAGIIGITGFLYMQSRSPVDTGIPASPLYSQALEFEAKREAIKQNLEVKGKSSYVNEANVYAPFAGTIGSWAVKEGGQISEGALLFEMETEELRKQLAIKQANVEKMQTEQKIQQAVQSLAPDDSRPGGGTMGEQEAFSRFTNKEKDKLQQKVDSINLNLVQTEIQELNRLLSEARYASTASGIFLFAENKEPKKVTEQELLGKIVDLTKLKMVATVGEYEVFQITEGLPVDIKIDALPNDKLKGTVTEVSKFAKSGSDGISKFDVTIELEPHDRLIAGLGLTGTILIDEKDDALVVPTLTVQRDDDDYFVYVLNEGVPEKRIVRIGMETAEQTEIIEGLQEGETVVLQ
ncbi:efflux RND transporter periplasmic adaptor subunit [Paenibacillus sp. J2TS4]|uniref:efflux RND transporter periplasmic adaptor subunit n=1 Tax=Paenibacillus sp. J2TS4 TaxID=2807194 RepID=UPI001BD0CDC0|nr:efflux RND transporter periplasmic adaptor subunit [Paenibacillus sp. J2TS4]